MILIGLIIILFFWVSVLSLIIFKLKQHYQTLIHQTKKHSIDEILDELLREQANNKQGIINCNKIITEIQKISKVYYNKIGIVHFNPFEKSGAEQSFVIALLNEMNNGITLNFMQTRDGLRVYTKQIRNGIGIGYELSDEEKKAIQKSE